MIYGIAAVVYVAIGVAFMDFMFSIVIAIIYLLVAVVARSGGYPGLLSRP